MELTSKNQKGTREKVFWSCDGQPALHDPDQAL